MITAACLLALAGGMAVYLLAEPESYRPPVTEQEINAQRAVRSAHQATNNSRVEAAMRTDVVK